MRISYDFYETKGVKASAVALGFFDGLHAGHRKVIEAAVAEKANGLTACVFTFTLGGERPQSKEGARLLQTESLKERYMDCLLYTSPHSRQRVYAHRRPRGRRCAKHLPFHRCR